jgi:hypothetical protein
MSWLPCCCGCRCVCVAGVPQCADGSAPVCPDGTVPTCVGSVCMCSSGSPGTCPCFDGSHTLTITLPNGFDAFSIANGGNCTYYNCPVPLDGSVWTISCTPVGDTCDTNYTPPCVKSTMCPDLAGVSYCCFASDVFCASAHGHVYVYLGSNGVAYLIVYVVSAAAGNSRDIAFIFKGSFTASNCSTLASTVWSFQGFCTYAISGGIPYDISGCVAGTPNPGNGFTIVVT